MQEIEIKKESKFTGQDDCCVCGEEAKNIVVIGLIQNFSGKEFLLCESEHCLNQALSGYSEDLEYNHLHRKEMIQEENWDHRDGK